MKIRITKKTLFNIHGWLGINLGLLLFVICFSGTFATLSNEVDWLLDPALRIEKKNESFQWERMYSNVKKTFPESRITNLAEQKNSFTEVGDYFAATAFIRTPEGQTVKVHLDPYTGEIKGYNSFFDVQRFFRNYHSFFFDRNFGGTLIVTFFGFFLLFSAITGFLFYKSWFKNLLQLRFKKGLRVFFTDAHKQLGIWSLIFTVIIALTGIFYFAEDILGMSGNFKVLVPDPPEKLTKSEMAVFGTNPELLPIDVYANNAVKAFPELNVEQIRIPSQPNQYVYIDGQDGNPFTRDRANKVYLHPFTGKVVHIQKASDLTAIELITDIVDPPHFGTFGGLTVKIIWFAFGLALSFSILAGTYLWYNRKVNLLIKKLNRRNRKPSQPEKHLIKFVPNFLYAVPKTLKGALISTLLTLLYLVVTGTFIITDGIKSLGPYPKDRITTIQDLQLGPWDITLDCEYPCTLEKDTKFMVNFNGNGIPNYDQIELQLLSKTDTLLKLPFNGPSAKASLTINEDNSELKYGNLLISILSLKGEKYSTIINPEGLKSAAKFMSDRFEYYPDKSYPKVPNRVYLFILFFALLTLAIIISWSFYMLKITRIRFDVAKGSST